MHFLLLDNQVSHREVRTGREGRLMDRRGKGGNGERRNVKSGALEVILAGNLSYHSDLVKALQQVRGERETERKTADLEVLCLTILVFHSTILNVAFYLMAVYMYRSFAQAHDRFCQYWIPICDIIYALFISVYRGTQVSAIMSFLSLLKPSHVNQSPVRLIGEQSDGPWLKGYEAELHIHLHQYSLCNGDGNW